MEAPQQAQETLAAPEGADPPLEAAVLAAAARDAEAAIALADLPEQVFAVPGYGAMLARVCAAQAAGRPLPPLPPEVQTAQPVPDVAAAAQRLRDLAAWRVVGHGLRDLAVQVGGQQGDPQAALVAMDRVAAEARQRLGEVRAGEVAPLAAGVQGLLDRLAEVAAARAATGRPVIGLTTGLGGRLDEVLNGWCPERTYVLGGEPGVGKTSLALASAIAAAKQGACAVYYDCENGPDALLLKALAAQANVSASDYERGFGDLNVLRQAAQDMAPILRLLFVVDARATQITPDQLLARAAKARAMARTNDALVIIDYLQKLYVPAEAYQRFQADRRREVEVASGACRRIAATLNCPVLAVSQLNRNAYARPGEDRTLGQSMAGLKESGQVEYDADAILTLGRTKEPNVIRVEIVKNRQGPSGDVVGLVRHPQTGRVAEVARP